MSEHLTIKLNNGVEMPMAGIGTFLLAPDEAEASCLSALACGYRLIDTANAYVNERTVGRAMRKSGLNRGGNLPGDQAVAQLLRAARRRGKDPGPAGHRLY